MRVCVGIHVHAEPERLQATLASVRRESPGAEILLLGDGPDPATVAALAGLAAVRQSSTQEPKGPPACFNRLAGESDADVVVLLESGAIVAHGWLDRLVAPLEADPRNGLAGPSTNRSWNEQAVDGDDLEVARRFGGQLRTLEPLYSLADFCYAVHRRVVEAIGGADEGYGLGPCWEMEYNVRAARAGFRAVWVCGAYVHRAPFTARRAREEWRLFDASRRRYQDAVCGLRLRRERSDYEPHCRGADCPHFAPRELIQLVRPLAVAPEPAPVPTVPAVPRPPEPPLVSCVMPTRNRADFALQAVRLFQGQDYPSRELLVVDDGDDGLEARLPPDLRIRYLRAPRGESIGAKRNRACAAARGDFVAQWDDDDWYAPERLTAQLEPLLAGRADVTGLLTPIFFELPTWRFWSVTPELHRRLFVENVHGGTLVFARSVWQRLARYPDASLAEDAYFLMRAKARGARIERLDGAGLFVYLRHATNAWRFACGAHVDGRGWRSAEEPPFSAEDRAFYAARSTGAAPKPDLPLASCIMPTCDRREWVAQAIAYFRRQDYPNRELLVLDDGEDRVADLIPSDPSIRYVALEQRLVLGEKRNRACELARGEVILHWDDDDWQAPHRVRYQVEQLQLHGTALCGPSRALYFDPASAQAWLYDYPAGARPWIAGNALCYRRELWRANRFSHVQVGEDTRFVWSPRAGRPFVLPDHRFFAGIVHRGNTSGKLTRGAYWHPRPLDEVRSLLGDDYDFYTG